MFFSDDMKDLVGLFEKHGVRYAVCGGFAVAHHGFLRATMDFDLLVLPDRQNAEAIMAALGEFGFGDAGIEETAFQKRGTAVTLGVQPNQIDLLTSMGSRPTAEILANAGVVRIHGISMKVVSYEDLLFAKRESSRAKDRIDAEELARIRRDGEQA
jgi:hypothetical protein